MPTSHTAPRNSEGLSRGLPAVWGGGHPSFLPALLLTEVAHTPVTIVVQEEKFVLGKESIVIWLHRHQIIPETCQAPRLERITSPQRALARDRPAEGAGAGRGRHLPCEGLRGRENVREASELVPPSATEPLPPPQPPSTDQLHLPSGPKSRRCVTSG